MTGMLWQPQTLTRAQMEERRLEEDRLLHAGKMAQSSDSAQVRGNLSAQVYRTSGAFVGLDLASPVAARRGTRRRLDSRAARPRLGTHKKKRGATASKSCFLMNWALPYSSSVIITKLPPVKNGSAGIVFNK